MISLTSRLVLLIQGIVSWPVFAFHVILRSRMCLQNTTQLEYNGWYLIINMIRNRCEGLVHWQHWWEMCWLSGILILTRVVVAPWDVIVQFGTQWFCHDVGDRRGDVVTQCGWNGSAGMCWPTGIVVAQFGDVVAQPLAAPLLIAVFYYCTLARLIFSS
jgi:hypothetical protein